MQNNPEEIGGVPVSKIRTLPLRRVKGPDDKLSAAYHDPESGMVYFADADGSPTGQTAQVLDGQGGRRNLTEKKPQKGSGNRIRKGPRPRRKPERVSGRKKNTRSRVTRRRKKEETRQGKSARPLAAAYSGRPESPQRRACLPEWLPFLLGLLAASCLICCTAMYIPGMLP